jgi:CBS domain-containing protein
VADLLGRDRGIRKLTFLPAGELPLSPAATVQAGTTGFRARAIADSHRERWLLVLDPERRPRGWVDSAVLGPDQIIAGNVVHPLGGTFYADESVLAALDAAILSAAGLAVCLGDDGKILGVVSHTEIARYLSGQRPAVPVAPLPTAPASPAPMPAPAPVPPSAAPAPPPAAEPRRTEAPPEPPRDETPRAEAPTPAPDPPTAVLPTADPATPLRKAAPAAPTPAVKETRPAPVPKPATPSTPPAPEPVAARSESAEKSVETKAPATSEAANATFSTGRWEWNAESGEWVQVAEGARSEAETS